MAKKGILGDLEKIDPHYRSRIPIEEWLGQRNAPQRYYLVTVEPAKPMHFDEGMSLNILLPANTRRHALKRVARYVPGIVTAVQLVKWKN